jgi:hypothetical protein
LRWHARGFCHRDEIFKDFVIGRFQSVGKAKPCSQKGRVDVDWLEGDTLIFRPSEALSRNQRTALEMDYGMIHGRLELTVRRAMRVYALRRLGFVENSQEPPVLNELRQLEWIAVEKP